MKRTAGSDAKGARIGAGLTLLIGLSLALLAAWPCALVTMRLVGAIGGGLDAEKSRLAQQELLNSGPLEAREGYALVIAGAQFTAALRDPQRFPSLQESLGGIASATRRTQLARLYQAAARMRQLEQAEQPMGEWWPSLRGYLTGLERADFTHYQGAVTESWAGIYRDQGLDAPDAAAMAQYAIGHPHGPFLQYFSQRLSALAETLGTNGDTDAATTLRRLLARLLRQWTVEQGPLGLRLLSADLLAQALQPADETSKPTDGNRFSLKGCLSGVENSEGLRATVAQWRQDYLDAARATPPTLFGLSRQPDPAAREEQTMIAWLLRCAALVGALIGATPLCVYGLRRRGGSDVWETGVTFAFGCLMALLIGLFCLTPDVADSRARASVLDAKPWVMVALGGTVLSSVAILLTTFVASRYKAGDASHESGGERSGARWLRGEVLGPLARKVWCGLALALIAAGWSAHASQRQAALVRNEALHNWPAAITGPQAENLLTPVRDWRP